MSTAPGILLTVVGGYLGAGKTTLLNHLLRDAGDRRLAVLVNDFGAIDIDAELIESRHGAIVSLTNGCICCAIGGDFIAALAGLRDVDDPPEQVIVEASGVADPGQIAVFGDLPGYVRDAVVVVVDAEAVRPRAGSASTGHQILTQLRAADLLVVNKTDLVHADALAGMRAWLRETVGPSTSIVEAAFGNVPTDVLLGARDTAAADERPRARDHHHEHGDHHPRYETWSWSGDAPLSGAGLVEALKGLPEGIVRAKGILHLREDARHRYVLQLVGRRYSVAPHLPWNDEQPRSRIVVIGLADSVDERRLDETMARLSLSPAGEAPPATTSGASGGD